MSDKVNTTICNLCDVFQLEFGEIPTDIIVSKELFDKLWLYYTNLGMPQSVKPLISNLRVLNYSHKDGVVNISAPREY